MKPAVKIVLGVAGVLVGLGFIMPAVALWRTQGALPIGDIGLLLLGLILTAGGLYSGTTGIRRLRS